MIYHKRLNVDISMYCALCVQGRLQVSGKGGVGEGLVGDCGLVFPGLDPGFKIIGGA